MNNKIIKFFQISFFIVFIPVVLINNVSEISSFFQDSKIFNVVIFYAFPILSLILFLFGILFYKTKIEPKGANALILIFIGLLFSLVSYGRPVLGLLLINDSEIVKVNKVKLKQIEGEVLDLNISAYKRLSAAQYYYFTTGNTIEFIDHNGTKSAYSPTKSDIKERKKYLIMEQQIQLRKNYLKKIVFNLAIIAILLLLSFFIVQKILKTQKW
ncbi:hypothetical protein DSCA_25330 [Desulfosarcina alkanivorans]|uniref:Uncharacterized protein n=1 Tax=Desulfosarcina alkanivorans TaxID=571177 RepID=A0A5K7YJA5_9BACT|nr:hypothetical protein [Desulfosarcina alkanivorans]BBO68603.1 hypothetical protein DSCA_25330 [Desulfosarcina alkanivorans]